MSMHSSTAAPAAAAAAVVTSGRAAHAALQGLHACMLDCSASPACCPLAPSPSTCRHARSEGPAGSSAGHSRSALWLRVLPRQPGGSRLAAGMADSRHGATTLPPPACLPLGLDALMEQLAIHVSQTALSRQTMQVPAHLPLGLDALAEQVQVGAGGEAGGRDDVVVQAAGGGGRRGAEVAVTPCLQMGCRGS